MATLRDISNTLGLSVTQVSRALNGHSDVNEETRKRVKEVARKLDYLPNVSARRLVTGRSGIVGLVLSGVPGRSDERLHMRIVGGMSAHFTRSGLQFILHIAEESDDIVDVYRRLIDSGSLDGFVLLGPLVNDPRIVFLKNRGVPFVLHGRTERSPDYPFFDIDNERIGYRLARYLIDRGHRQIAFANGPQGLAYVKARDQGYRRALAEAGIEFDVRIVQMDRMTEDFGLIAGMRIFSGERRPTAIICSSTLIAKGVYQALLALGLSIPDDVSVVAHDDLLPETRARAFNPSLTCTRAPLEDSWKPLAEALVGALQGAPLSEIQRVGRVDFVERNSVATLRP